MKKIGIIFITLVILGFIGYHVFDVENILLKKMYPKEYSKQVYQSAQKYNVDPLLIFAIIKAESNFNEDAVSQSNAVGLMQLMENTAVEMSNQIEGIEVTSIEMLYDPETNIQLGVKYFSTLLEKYNNNIYLALAAYNAGMGNVSKWIKEGIIKEDGSDIENIPYKETNNYVRKILNSYRIYQELYEN